MNLEGEVFRRRNPTALRSRLKIARSLFVILDMTICVASYLDQNLSGYFTEESRQSTTIFMGWHVDDEPSKRIATFIISANKELQTQQKLPTKNQQRSCNHTKLTATKEIKKNIKVARTDYAQSAFRSTLDFYVDMLPKKL